jgi:hypothetical protein
MSTIEGEEVFTRDSSSGQIHRRINVDGELYTIEGCNLDDAGAYEVVDLDTVKAAPLGVLCSNDFPHGAPA